MPKQALLVDFNIRTRVVVDLPENADPNDDEYFDDIARAAIEKVRQGVTENEDYPYGENITDIEYDEEIPYGKALEDN